LPFPENWTEELVAEWLGLDGYLVELGLPACVTPQGGRYTADVVGAKIIGKTLEIKHIEVGQLAFGQKSIDSLNKKFSNQVCTSIENYFKDRFNFTGKANYHKIYVASFWTKNTLTGAANLGIRVYPLPKFIQNQVIPTIRNYRSNPPSLNPKVRGITALPNVNWLLKLLEYLDQRKLLK